MNKPLVSVIITTKNEEKHVEACLKSIAGQTYPSIECIIVDNSSTDSTKKIARRFTPHILDKGPERSAQRNYGALKACGEYLLFLDADMELTPDVIDECVKVIGQKTMSSRKNKSYKALVIPEKSIGSGFWAQCKILERSFYEGVDWMEAARFFQKYIFWELRGYDESLTGPEDFDLPQRLKARFGAESIGRITSYIYHNEGNLSLSESLKKKFYYGKRMRRYMHKSENRTAGMKQGNIISRFSLYFSHSRQLFRNPFVGVGMLYMKILDMTALGLGYFSGI